VYYGKQNSSNRDYYNSYSDSSYKYKNRKDYLTLILKILVILLLLVLSFIGFVLISNKAKVVEHKVQRVDKQSSFKVTEEEPIAKTEELSKKLLKEIAVAKENKANLSQVNLTQNDIANIISIVMHKINKSKKNKSKKNVVSDNDYTKELLSQAVDRLNTPKNIIPKLLNTKKIIKDISSLDSDHYNKVVINRPKDEKYTNDSLSQLSIEINSAIDEDTTSIDTSSNYTKAISKEITVRSNEMRIIVVKKGDSLSKIAKRAYGSYDSYIKIFEANPEIIKNPNEIYAGQRLRIPL